MSRDQEWYRNFVIFVVSTLLVYGCVLVVGRINGDIENVHLTRLGDDDAGLIDIDTGGKCECPPCAPEDPPCPCECETKEGDEE